MRLAALQVGHDNARQAAHPLQPHMMAGEEELGAHIGAGLVGEPVTPPLSRASASTGAVTILKSVAASALVRM